MHCLKFHPCFGMSCDQVRKYKSMILEDLENALAEHAPPGGGELTSELPPLTIDGIPVSVDKMTQVGSRWHYEPGMQVIEFSALPCKCDIF